MYVVNHNHLWFVDPNRSLLSGVLYPRKQQQPEKEYDSNYASMTPVPQNTGQNNVIRVVSAAPPSYTQGPTQYGKGTVYEHILCLALPFYKPIQNLYSNRTVNKLYALFVKFYPHHLGYNFVEVNLFPSVFRSCERRSWRRMAGAGENDK